MTGDDMLSCGKCDICESEKSFFWHPFLYGVPVYPVKYGMEGMRLEQGFMMCDECFRQFNDWILKKKNQSQTEVDD